MTDSVDTDALRDLAQKTAEEIADVAAHRGGRIRMTVPANVDTDTDLLVGRLEEMALAAADELDALRARIRKADQDRRIAEHNERMHKARAERAEAVISAAPHAQDCHVNRVMPTAVEVVDGTWNGPVCTCRKADYARASQPASSERQMQYDDGGWSRTVEVDPASEVEQ